MNIRENFYSKLQTIREEVEVKPNKNSEVVEAQKAAKKALKHVNKNNYEAAHASVEGTSLAKNLKSHLDRAQKHWTKMNMLNNSSHKAKSEEHYNEIRNRANDHQDQAEHHHDKAVQFLKDHLPMNEEVEQLDELEGYQGRKGQKLLGKVFKRANKRAADAAWKDPKTAKRNSETADNAWGRFNKKNK
jgi:hypothetical protein